MWLASGVSHTYHTKMISPLINKDIYLILVEWAILYVEMHDGREV